MKWSIYTEGYATNGERAGAQLEGVGTGETFGEAVADYVSKITDPTARAYWTRISDGTWAHWGCRAFPTLEEAQRTFG